MHILSLFCAAALALLPTTQACICAAVNSAVKPGVLEDLGRYGRRAPPISFGGESKTAITGVRVFDGTRFREQPETIVIHGSHISNQVDIAGVQTIIDGQGKFLIPGLIESHAHPSTLADMQDLTAFGVTTVLNMACGNYTLCSAMRNLSGLVDFLSAGLPALAPNAPHMTPGAALPPDFDADAVVGAAFANHSDYYKIRAAPGELTQEQQNRLVATVHALGKRSVTHASYVSVYQQAAGSGTDVIQHIAADGPLPDSLIEQILANGQLVTPTLNIFWLAFTNPIIGNYLRPNGTDNSTYAAAAANVAALYRAGVPLFIGSDTASAAGVRIPFGKTVHCELEFFVRDAGVSPVDALRSATVLPAQLQNLTGRGVIAPRMRADLVLLNANPLEDITNTRDIANVWTAGVEYREVGKWGSTNCSKLELQSS